MFDEINFTMKVFTAHHCVRS